MLKNKPLLITAIVFGGIGLLIIILGAVLFIDGGNDALNAIGSVFGMEKGKLTTATICQFSIVFEAMAFVVGYRALRDEAETMPDEHRSE